MGNFTIDATDLHWMDGCADDPEDLCLHGHAIAHIGGEQLSYDCTVSATALYLLKSLTENHILHEDNQMLPCCGHFYLPDARLENVTICGCDNGIDWTILHQDKDVVFLLESGSAATVPLEDYRREVYRFADKIESFYRADAPKKLPRDEFARNGYLAFWNEWHRRRNA